MTQELSPFTTYLPALSNEPSSEEVLDVFIGTLGNVELTTELLQKKFQNLTQLRVIRILSSNQQLLNEAIRTFSLIEGVKLKTKMALLLEDEMLHLSPADLAKNYIALSGAIMQATTPLPSQQGTVNNTQINIAQSIREALPPHVQEALRILTEGD